MADAGVTKLDMLIRNTQGRVDEHDRLSGALQPYPEQHRRAVELVLLYRDCLFELEQTRSLLMRGRFSKISSLDL